MFNRTRETLSEVKRLTVEKAPRVSLYDRFKFVVIEYGKVALAFHASGLAVAMSSSYFLIVHVMGGIAPVMCLRVLLCAPTHSVTCTHARTHSLTHTHTLSLTDSTRTHPHSLTLSHLLTHSARTHSLTLAHSLTHSARTRSLSLSLSGIEPVMGLLPHVISSHVPHEAGTLAVAFFMAECTAPPRYALTIVVAPLIAEKIRGRWLGDVLGLLRREETLLSLAYLPGRGLVSKGL